MDGRTLNHYKIESELGHGGMGVVYRAKDTKLDRTVAIKFLSADLTSDEVARERFVREAKAAASVEHDSICAIFEIGETEEKETFIVMPLYEGKTLKELISEGPLEPFKAVDLSIQIGSGLAAAHAKGIVHRDIKPGNVMVTKRGKVKILDFGLAKLGGQLDLTKSRSSIGTIPYMSPEQIRGDTIDERTDIWALGAVMYEMLTGKRPFTGEYEQAVTYSILNVDPEPLNKIREDLPEGLADVVARCLAKQADLRYQTISDLLKDIEVPSGVRPFTGSYTREVPRETNKRLAILTVAGIFIAMATFSLYTLFGGSSSEESFTGRRLAILPFQVIGTMEEGEALASGLLETLTSSLSRLDRPGESLWVVPSREVNSMMSISDAYGQTGANLVVTGSIQQDGGLIRVSLTLNDATTLTILDSNQYDDSGSGSFAIQDEAFRLLSRMLRLELSEDETAAIAIAQSSVRSANDAYVKAIGYLRNRQTSEELDIAIGLFTSAVMDDSLFALAYAGLGSAYWQKYRQTNDPRWVVEAVDNSEKALRLNENLAEVHTTLGSIRQGQGDNDGALEAFRRALEIDPSHTEAYRLRAGVLRDLGRMSEAEASLRLSTEMAPDYWRGFFSLSYHYYQQQDYEQAIRYARDGLEIASDRLALMNILGASLWYSGRVADAIEIFERVISINPDYSNTQSNLATSYFYIGRFEDAVRVYEAVSASRPNDYDYRGYLADAYYWAGRDSRDVQETYRDAIELARRSLSVNPRDAEAMGSMAGYFAHLGQTDSAEIYLQRSVDLRPPGTIDGESSFGIGETYLHLGDVDRAKEWFEQALSQNGGWMKLQFSPWLEPIRDDVDFMNRIAVYKD